LIATTALLLTHVWVEGSKLPVPVPSYETYRKDTSEFSSAELEDYGFRVFNPTDTTITLHLVTPDEISSKCGKDAYACAFAKNVIGVGPCEIYLPTSSIKYEPHYAVASWVDENMHGTLAHEILHCFHPNWHVPFDRGDYLTVKIYNYTPSRWAMNNRLKMYEPPQNYHWLHGTMNWFHVPND